MAVQDPSISGVPGRYATALFELARDAKSIDKVGGDLERFAALLSESADLTRLVRSPVYSTQDQARAIGAILKKAKISGLTANFIGLVTNNRRLFAVRDMISAFHLFCEGYCENVSTAFEHASFIKWIFAVTVIFIEGVFGLSVTFVLIVRSSEVVDLLLNFTAIEFVSLLGTQNVSEFSHAPSRLVYVWESELLTYVIALYCICQTTLDLTSRT